MSARVVCGVALFVAACGGTTPQPAVMHATVVCADGRDVDLGASCGPAGYMHTGREAEADAGAIATAPPPSAPTYPPPKSTTISVASAAGDACDQELTAGDDAFEANDLDGAEKHYLAAKTAAPKRSGPMVGLARVKIAKQNVPYDFAAAKGNAQITTAAKDLKHAAQLEPSLDRKSVV